MTECLQSELEFQDLDGRRVVADFDGQKITSDGGLVLLREVDLQLGLTKAAATAFTDERAPERVKHSVREMVAQRIFGLAAGYEDLNDHDSLRCDPMMALVIGKSDPNSPCAGKSTLNRLELSPDLAVCQSERYHKIRFNRTVIDELLIEMFFGSWREVPEEICLDLDPTDQALHGSQEGRFYHGYYGNYCYLPLYIFCGDHLLGVRLRTADHGAAYEWDKELPRIIVAIRKRWPQTRIVVRGDSGMCCDELMSWCEDQEGVDYVLGLARNDRLEPMLAPAMARAKAESIKTGESSRLYAELSYKTLDSWKKERRVVGKAEWLKGDEEGQGKSNARFVVTSLSEEACPTQLLYEKRYCGRGDMENKIKQQDDLFADRMSTGFMASNELRLYLSGLAYVLMNALRQRALGATELARAYVGTIRARLFKVGAEIRVSCRRILIRFSSSWPRRDLFVKASHQLKLLIRT